MSIEKTESELQNNKRNSIPIHVKGIGTRISAVCKTLGSRKDAAEAAGVSTDTLQRYIREDVQPSIGPIVALAYTANVSLDWLSTGKGSMHPEAQSPVRDLEKDLDVLEELIKEVEGWIQDAEVTIDPSKKAVLYRLLYEEALEGRRMPKKADVARYLKLVS